MSVDSGAACAKDPLELSGPIGLTLRVAGFSALVFVVCWASVELPRELGRAAPIWPANALIL